MTAPVRADQRYVHGRAHKQARPTKPKRIGRTWMECVDEIYDRKHEPWTEIRIGSTVIATCRNGSFVPLIAPVSAGKSTLALQMLVAHALNYGPAVYLTYELDGDEAVARAIGQMRSFAWGSVLRGEVPRAQVPDVPRLRILERDEATLENLAKVVAELRAKYPDQPILAIVDYIQGTPAPPGKERGHTANISIDLRRAAKANRVVLIGVSQASMENSKKLRAGDLLGIESSATGAETAQIERDAYVILTLADRREVDPDTVAWRLSVAKYRLGQADMVYELHYRGRIGTWEVLGEPVRAAVVRESRETEGKVKKFAKLKRSITQLVLTSSKPLSKNEISKQSTGNNDLKSKAIGELLQEGVIVHVEATRGGAALIWGPGMESAAAATQSEDGS